MSPAQASTLADVFLWAEANELDVRYSTMSMGSYTMPVVRFTRGDQHFEITLRSLDELGPRMHYLWDRIGAGLLTTPFVWKEKT